MTGQVGMRPPTTAGLNPVDEGFTPTTGAPPPTNNSPNSSLLFATPSVAGGSAYEGAGTEVSVTAPGSRPEAPTIAVSDLGSYTTTPNASHASSLSGSALATITSLSPASTASGTGTIALTVNGTGFTRASVVYVNGVAQTTTYVSSTQLTVAAAPKKATAGTLPVTVVTGGTTTAATNWTFT
jgi:hypothetical protein